MATKQVSVGRSFATVASSAPLKQPPLIDSTVSIAERVFTTQEAVYRSLRGFHVTQGPPGFSQRQARLEGKDIETTVWEFLANGDLTSLTYVMQHRFPEIPKETHMVLCTSIIVPIETNPKLLEHLAPSDFMQLMTCIRSYGNTEDLPVFFRCCQEEIMRRNKSQTIRDFSFDDIVEVLSIFKDLAQKNLCKIGILGEIFQCMTTEIQERLYYKERGGEERLSHQNIEHLKDLWSIAEYDYSEFTAWLDKMPAATGSHQVAMLDSVPSSTQTESLSKRAVFIRHLFGNKPRLTLTDKKKLIFFRKTKSLEYVIDEICRQPYVESVLSSVIYVIKQESETIKIPLQQKITKFVNANKNCLYYLNLDDLHALIAKINDYETSKDKLQITKLFVSHLQERVHLLNEYAIDIFEKIRNILEKRGANPEDIQSLNAEIVLKNLKKNFLSLLVEQTSIGFTRALKLIGSSTTTFQKYLPYIIQWITLRPRVLYTLELVNCMRLCLDLHEFQNANLEEVKPHFDKVFSSKLTPQNGTDQLLIENLTPLQLETLIEIFKDSEYSSCWRKALAMVDVPPRVKQPPVVDDWEELVVAEEPPIVDKESAKIFDDPWANLPEEELDRRFIERLIVSDLTIGASENIHD